MSRAWLLGNALWLQAGWWGCVLSVRYPWLVLLVAAGLALHLWLSPKRREECVALLRVAALGCLLDTGLGLLGVFDFGPHLLPLWLALLWLVLASGLRHSLAWAGRPAWRGALLGLFGGPAAYLAGAPLAQVGLPMGTAFTALLLAAIWALWLPLCLRLAQQG